MRTLTLVLLAASAVAFGPSHAQVRIAVGPNVLVSRDGNVSHVESAVAANPGDPLNLVATAISFTLPQGGYVNKTYATFDGGFSWYDARLPEERDLGSADPKVAFTPRGTALQVGLVQGMSVYRSEDGGRSWLAPARLGRGYDRVAIAVDQSTGPTAGQIYVTGNLDAGPRLHRSVDDGRTFDAPVTLPGIVVTDVLVLSDGAVLVPLYTGPDLRLPENRGTPMATYGTVRSTDAGATFSALRPGFEQQRYSTDSTLRRRRAGSIVGDNTATFAADTRSTRYRDRVYAAFPDMRWTRGKPRIAVVWSGDGGATWSAPTMVDASAPASASQFLPAIAVNDSGVVGVMWLDTRASAANDAYDVFFSASLDGGETFLPPVRVSSEPSRPAGPGNMRPALSRLRYAGDTLIMDFLSGYSRWRDAGDYVGLTSDATGVFHPVWPDSRHGTFQLETARIELLSDAPMPAAMDTATRPVGIVLDPSRYDAAKRELVVPVRIRNTTADTLFAPIVATLTSVGDTTLVRRGYMRPEDVVTILNATNGKPGSGASFDFSRALGTLGLLAPGAVSGAVDVRLRVATPAATGLHWRMLVSTRARRE
ncbi:MAG TPA: sialidase family protein [Gemmatimonadaceae bacterium]|nr:sialidase family protein [Gemmatimonadaceae bacterium]